MVAKPEDPTTDNGNYGVHWDHDSDTPNRIRADYENCADTNHGLFLEPVSAGEWYFVAYTRDNSSGETRLYANDLGVVDSEVWTDTPCVNDMPLQIGGEPIADDEFGFNGVIDDVHIYDRALSAAEVEELYNESPDMGLVAHYPFSGSADDHSGNGYHGEVFGATLTDDRFGNPNSAYQFDGVDDYIHINDVDPFMLTSWTIAAWFKTSTLESDRTIVCKLEDPSDDRGNFALMMLVDNLPRVCGAYETCPSDFDHPLYSEPIVADVWCFAAYTRDHTAGETKLYINGDGVVDSGVWNDEPCTNYQPVEIGRSTNTDFEFEGVIDDVRIYDRR